MLSPLALFHLIIIEDNMYNIVMQVAFCKNNDSRIDRKTSADSLIWTSRVLVYLIKKIFLQVVTFKFFSISILNNAHLDYLTHFVC